ncbi:Galactan beta-1 4-galactosyltransferase GALS1 [Bienertia sinuspersici]
MLVLNLQPYYHNFFPLSSSNHHATTHYNNSNNGVNVINTTTITAAKTTKLFSLSTPENPRKLPPKNPNKREFKTLRKRRRTFRPNGGLPRWAHHLLHRRISLQTPPRVRPSLAFKILPDWGYGRVYTVIVVNCTFNSNPNEDNNGGNLFMYAYYSQSSKFFEKFSVLEENPNSYNHTIFTSPPKFDYLYCGSSLYGDLNPARIREWVAYHAWIFGSNSHFVFHDAGGVSGEVMKVLEPWIKKGRVTFLVVNDCLHRYKFDAKWTFYFDVDEYLYLPQGNSLNKVMKEQWGFEKLLFRDWRTKIRRDRKYAIQARNVLATGVHMSENIVGKSLHRTENKLRYYHYHNSIQVKGEPCRVFLPPSAKRRITFHEKLPYIYDIGMKKLIDVIKRFEGETLGTSKLPS